MSSREQLPGRSHRHRYEGPFFRRLLLNGIRHIPKGVQDRTMPLWAGLFYGLLPAARRSAEANLDQVLGPAPLLQRKRRGFRLFLNYAQAVKDTYATHLRRDAALPVLSVGRPNMLNALAQGKGVIAVTGHLGMWQIGPFLAEWREFSSIFYTAMAEEPNPLVQEFEEKFRSRFRVIYTTGSPFSSLQILSVLRQGSIVGMQMDRHLGGQTVPVTICGRPAHFAAGPATLSRLSGAPLVPNFFVIERDQEGRRRILHYIEGPIEVAHTRDRATDVAEATKRLVRVYERYVTRYPEQWYNFFDFWQAPPPPPSPPAPGTSGRRPDLHVVEGEAEGPLPRAAGDREG